MRVVCLAGGVGGAKLAEGLAQVVEPGELSVVVNTGDDFERHSLAVWPDHDTVLYTLAGLADPVQGWGLSGETWNVMDALSSLGEATWFRLGDRDLATHLYRTERLRGGARPTEVAFELGVAFGVPSAVLPMTDSPVRTKVKTDDGWLDFQDYFVRLHQEPEVRGVVYEGIEAAAATPEVEAAIAAAEVIVVAPSNPVVSIGPILAVPGVLEAIQAARARGVPAAGVSGIVGGRALRGPADRMLASLGEASSAVGVARRYASARLVDGMAIDVQDEHLAGEVRRLGLEVLTTDTVMTDRASRAALAAKLLAFAATLAGPARTAPEPGRAVAKPGRTAAGRGRGGAGER
jgi:LPPG:FO 2-phospho-L-lactate transferase